MKTATKKLREDHDNAATAMTTETEGRNFTQGGQSSNAHGNVGRVMKKGTVKRRKCPQRRSGESDINVPGDVGPSKTPAGKQ